MEQRCHLAPGHAAAWPPSQRRVMRAAAAQMQHQHRHCCSCGLRPLCRPRNRLMSHVASLQQRNGAYRWQFWLAGPQHRQHYASTRVRGQIEAHGSLVRAGCRWQEPASADVSAPFRLRACGGGARHHYHTLQREQQERWIGKNIRHASKSPRSIHSRRASPHCSRRCSEHAVVCLVLWPTSSSRHISAGKGGAALQAVRRCESDVQTQKWQSMPRKPTRLAWRRCLAARCGSLCRLQHGGRGGCSAR